MSKHYGIVLASTCTRITRLVRLGDDWAIQFLRVDQEVVLTTDVVTALARAVPRGKAREEILAQFMAEEVPPPCLFEREEGT